MPRDRYGFVRDEEYARKEREFGVASSRTSEAVSMEWIAFLKRLSATGDAMDGTKALRRNEFGQFVHCRKGGASVRGVVVVAGVVWALLRTNAFRPVLRELHTRVGVRMRMRVCVRICASAGVRVCACV